MHDVTVETRPGEDLRGALVVVGTPTLGLVGAITAQHLVRTLRMEEAGRLSSPGFPPIVLVKEGLARPPVRIFLTGATCKVGVACSRLVVVSAEFAPEDEVLRPFARAVIAWARALGAPLVLVPDGMEKDEEARDEVFGVASSARELGFLADVGVPALAEGLVAGASAALLEEGERQGVPVVTLLGETNVETPDARAAAAIVAVLAKVLPELSLDVPGLLADAEEIERSFHEMRERARLRSEDGATPMFT